MAKQINWLQVKSWFLADETRSLKDVANHYGLSLGTVKTKSALDKWYLLRDQALANATTKAIINLEDKQADFLVKQFEAGKELMTKGLEELKKRPARGAGEAAQVVKTGVDIARGAIKLNNQEDTGVKRKVTFEEFFES